MGSLELKTISIIEKEPKDSELDYNQKREVAQKPLDGIGHIATGEYYWDFVDKNHWALSTVLGDKSNIIKGSFQASHNFVYISYQCEQCEAVFNLPVKVEKCIFCECNKLQLHRRKSTIRRSGGRVGVLTDVNPELLAMAQQDIANHQASQGPQYDIDWDFLDDNM